MNFFATHNAEWEMAFWTILVGIVCNISCALLGCYLVLRRMSLLGDAISHGIVPGVTFAYLISGGAEPLPMFLGALAVGLLTAFLTQSLHAWGKVPEDASMGIVFTSLFAIGVIAIKAFASTAHLDDCLFTGDILFAMTDRTTVAGIEVPRILLPLAISLVATIVFIVVLWKELRLVAFDPALATSMGISASVVHYLLMGMVASAAVASFEAVGAILVVAMLIVPAATAQLLTDRLRSMLIVAAIVGALAAVFGYAGARYLDASVAGMTAVAAGLLFGLAVFFAPRHGLVSRWLHTLSLSLRIRGEDLLAAAYRAGERALADTVLGRGGVPAGAGAPAQLAISLPANEGRILNRLAAWRLVRKGLAQRDDNGIELTEEGRRLAHSLVRSHRLWEAYLDHHFDLPRDHLHDPAERIEHFIGPDLQQQIEESLERPAADPHGQPIPPQS